MTKKSYLNDNKDVIEGFTKAIQKGLDYVFTHTDKEVAEVITSYFPDTSLNDLVKIIDRYKKQDTWPKTTSFSEESFNHLQDIMIENGAIKKKVSYDKLISNVK